MTRKNPAADLLIRMQPEFKRRVEKAARLVGKTKTDWVLKAIKVILHVQELQDPGASGNCRNLA
jgi:hypothetical protein